MPQKRHFLLVFIALAFVSSLAAQTLLTKPVKVLGDPHFIGSTSSPLQISSDGPNSVEGRELNLPLGVAVDNSVSPPNVYIADTGNNRVLGFQYSTQLVAGATADLVLGQVDLFTNLAQGGSNRSTGMSSPTGLAVDSAGNLYVADTGNNRVLRYPKPFNQPAGFAFPDVVIGQTSLSGKSANAGGLSATSLALNSGNVNRSGIVIDSAGNLWVADYGNNRVLRFPASVLKAGQNGPAADLVLGQADFASSNAQVARLTKTALSHPQGLAFDATGRLYVTDGFSRILVYPAGATTNSAALRILGVDAQSTAPATQSSLNNPFSVVVTSAGVLAPDTFNNRLLLFPSFDQWPAETAQQISPAATAVIGQASYTVAKANQGNGDASASSFNLPADIAVSGSETFVADAQNHRILVFASTGTGLSGGATRVIGQLGFAYDSVNLIEGKEFNFVGTVSGAAILDETSSPPHLYVADAENNRILGFKDFTHAQNGQKADIVLGQPDLLRSVVNYPSGDPTTPNAQGLRLPGGLSLDSAGNLYVADTGNSRILRFPAPFASGTTALESADLVIGQQDFRTIVTDATDRTTNLPFGLTLTADGANASVTNSGYLIVSDTGNNRVLFFAKPFSSGMSATKVLGQLNLTSNATSSDPQRFAQPRGVAVDSQDRVIVADTGNHRVQIFDKAANVANYATRTASVGGLGSPLYIAPAAKGFWVADSAQSVLVHYPSIDQLIINAAPDATQPAVSPRSAYVDKYNNLLLADGANRVLYFAPAVSVTNAANYSGRAVTAGQIAAVFPIGTGSILAGDTGTFSGLPLPVTLGSTQVLVNGNPAPLFFVSPGQINMVFPNRLASGGTADLQIVNQTTGQVFGGAELQLASASPGLFTANATGAGQVAAINVQDNTVNSAANAVARGQYISLYGTGVGPVAGAPPDGQAPTGTVAAADLPQVLLGTSSTTFLPSSNVTFSGLAPTLVGVWQINILIPDNAQTGPSVPIKVFQNSISSSDPGSTSPTNTTIAIK